MILGLCLFTAIVVCLAVATCASRKADQGTRERGAARRFRQIRRNPDRVNLLDVENLLISASIPATTVKRIMRKAGARRIGARTMWRWAATHGSDKVVLAIGADLTEDTLLDHLDAGTAPHWPSVSATAQVNDQPVRPAMWDLTCPDDISSLDSVPVGVVEQHRFGSLPPIANPGLAPFDPIDAWDNEDGDEGLGKAA